MQQRKKKKTPNQTTDQAAIRPAAEPVEQEPVEQESAFVKKEPEIPSTLFFKVNDFENLCIVGSPYDIGVEISNKVNTLSIEGKGDTGKIIVSIFGKNNCKVSQKEFTLKTLCKVLSNANV